MANTSGTIGGGSMGGMNGDSLNSGAGAGGLDSVVGAVDAALTRMDPPAGAAAVAGVLRALQGAPGLGGVTGTLEQLQTQLQSGTPDGPQVGRLLTALSRQTRDVAGSAGPISGVLHLLAGRLDAAGSKLGGDAG